MCLVISKYDLPAYSKWFIMLERNVKVSNGLHRGTVRNRKLINGLINANKMHRFYVSVYISGITMSTSKIHTAKQYKLASGLHASLLSNRNRTRFINIKSWNVKIECPSWLSIHIKNNTILCDAIFVINCKKYNKSGLKAEIPSAA